MIKPEYDTRLFPYWTTLPIRFRDLDPLNHVNNALFNTFYEEARISFIRDVPGFANQLKGGYSFVLANLHIDFIRPVTYPAQLLIGSGIKSVGNTSITSFQAIYTEESKRLVSVAESTGVWFDLSRQRPARIPDVDNMDEFIVDLETL